MGKVKTKFFLTLLLINLIYPQHSTASEVSLPNEEKKQYAIFPLALTEYKDNQQASIWQKLKTRAIAQNGFNLIALLIFLGAIIHSFNTSIFQKMEHRQRIKEKKAEIPTSSKTHLLGFLGEIEIVFILWTCLLMIASTLLFSSSYTLTGILEGFHQFKLYISKDISYTEPLFVVVIMAISASRPILNLTEKIIERIVQFFGESIKSWWFIILTITPLMGSFITEPAAMTISALLLARKFYCHSPNLILSYGTLGLLFVNISIGGTLTNFAAPPILVVASRWDLGMNEMLTMFGYKSVLGIFLSTALYFFLFRKSFEEMEKRNTISTKKEKDPIPVWISISHLLFLAWTVFISHYPPLFIGGFFLFLGLMEITKKHQTPLNLKTPLLVGLFLAGLITLGKCQGWWLDLILKSIDNQLIFFFGSLGLTSINDNAAITFLASQVEGIEASTRYYILSGAVIGGGLTIIANAPNPAGKNILQKYFPEGIQPSKLFLAALLPTIIIAIIFLLITPKF